MSDLAQRLRDSTQFYHSDCELKMGCAAHIEELEEQRDELLEALEKMVGLFEPGRVYDFREVSAISSESLKIALAAIAKAKGS